MLPGSRSAETQPVKANGTAPLSLHLFGGIDGSTTTNILLPSVIRSFPPPLPLR